MKTPLDIHQVSIHDLSMVYKSLFGCKPGQLRDIVNCSKYSSVFQIFNGLFTGGYVIYHSKKVKKFIQTIFYGKAKNKYALELTPDIDSTAE